jgi:hypothetical protein
MEERAISPVDQPCVPKAVEAAQEDTPAAADPRVSDSGALCAVSACAAHAHLPRARAAERNASLGRVRAIHLGMHAFTQFLPGMVCLLGTHRT